VTDPTADADPEATEKPRCSTTSGDSAHPENDGQDTDSRSSSLDVTIEAPPVEAAESLATWWVALADEQRAHGSHLLGEPNRQLIQEAVARHIVTDGLLVARLDPSSEAGGRDEAEDNAHADVDAAGFEADTGTDADDSGSDDSDDGGRAIVGFVMFGPETGSYDQSVDRGIVENVFVRADYRGRGVGSALLDAAERALIDSGVDRIALEAMANNDAARRLYARRGYRPHRVELEAPVSELSGDGRTDGDDDGNGSEKDGTEKR
jgi:ribosomal protein S18 acetylase RimI-like enzyme